MNLRLVSMGCAGSLRVQYLEPKRSSYTASFILFAQISYVASGRRQTDPNDFLLFELLYPSLAWGEVLTV